MSPQLPVVSGSEAVRALGKVGFLRVSQRGSHVKLRNGVEYKYTLGTWNNVEKGASCDEIANRSFKVAPSEGDSSAQTVQDTVKNWRNVAPCGD